MNATPFEAVPVATAAATSRPVSTPAATPSEYPRVADGRVTGTWLVHLQLEDKAAARLVAQEPFQDRVFDVRSSCPSEPCRTATLNVYFLRDPTPALSLGLTRSRETYTSEASPARTGSCRTADGTVVEGGASVSATVTLWRQIVKPAGTAVTHEELGGAVEYRGTPTALGKAAGCADWSAAFDISGREGWYVPTEETVTPTAAATRQPQVGLVANRPFSASVAGATVSYFSFRGSTYAALRESMVTGGLRECGEIHYSWVKGDKRPAGCMEYVGVDGAISWATPPFGCMTLYKPPVYRLIVHLPQWTSPASVPGPLYEWWRKAFVFVRDHEAGHVAIAQKHLAMLPDLLTNVSCANEPQVMTQWLAGLSRAQEAFDRVQYQIPWPTPPAGY